LNQRVGLVVPTLGERPDYSEQSLRSIRAAGEAHILPVAPRFLDTGSLESSRLIDSVIADPRNGLAAAINVGIKPLPESVEFVNWL
jgi:hypothetical protein